MGKWCIAVVALGVGCSSEPFSSGSPFVSSDGMSTEDSVGDDDDDGEGTGGTPGSGGADDDDSTGQASGDPSGDPSDDTGSGTEVGTEGETGEPGDPGDPNCYSEPLDPSADIGDLVAAYGNGAWKDTLITAMERRYPAGAYLLDQQRNDPYFDQFSDPFNWGGMVSWLDTLVHEQTHLFNAYHAIDVGQTASLFMREDLIIYLPAEQGFARSEILADLPAEVANSTYASTYLTGSQGDRGFNPLLDETCAYINEVPGMATFGEFYNGGVSLRDGSAALLVFVQAYLRRARTVHPDFYAWAQSQPAYVEAVQLLWQRAQFFYEAVGDDHPNLGISDGTYRAIAQQEENIEELRMFTGAALGAGACLEGS